MTATNSRLAVVAPPVTLPPELVAARDREIAHLLALREAHATAIRQVDSALAALGQRRPVNAGARREDHPDGLYSMLLRYLDEGWDGESFITSASAFAWMMQHGWRTRSADRPRAVAIGLARLAQGSKPRLRRIQRGSYWPSGAVLPERE